MEMSPLPSYASNHAPVEAEVETEPLAVTGALPDGLDGLLIRNGPNPPFPAPQAHWFTGDGMLHSFKFSDGEVTYRNRWIRTRHWQAEKAAGRSVPNDFGPPGTEANDGVANTNVLWHDGRLLALEEMHLPIEIHPLTLETLGPTDFDGSIQGPFTAHPKIDPDSGELVFFGYGTPVMLSNGLSLGVIGANGVVEHVERFSAPYSSMVHDFAITRKHVLLPIMPLTGSMSRALAGKPPYAWEPDMGSYVGVIPRHHARASNASPPAIEWWSGPPCFLFHVMNAWETDKAIHADVVEFTTPPHFPWPDASPIEDGGSGYLTRWTFDLHAGDKRFSRHRLIDVPGEFPRIDERFTGMAYRHGWFTGHGEDRPRQLFSRIVHVDHQLGTLDTYDLATADSASEPVFVARGQHASEGEGWLLVVVFRGEAQHSDLCIFNALRISEGPIATVHVPYRIPNGFHGNWIAAANIGYSKAHPEWNSKWTS